MTNYEGCENLLRASPSEIAAWLYNDLKQHPGYACNRLHNAFSLAKGLPYPSDIQHHDTNYTQLYCVNRMQNLRTPAECYLCPRIHGAAAATAQTQ